MSRNEMIAKIELLNRYESMIAELKEQAESIKDDIKAEMIAQDTETLFIGQYIIRWTDVLSNRFDSTAFKKVMPDVYKAYVKQVASRRFTIS